MQYRNNQRGLATLETAACGAILAFVSILAFGTADLYSKIFSVRRITEQVLAQHSQTTLKADLDLNGDVAINVDVAATQKVIDDEVIACKNALRLALSDLGHGEESFRVEAFVRIASIDPITGRFLGYEGDGYEASQGSLSIPQSIERQYSFNEAFSDLSQSTYAGEVSYLAEPNPETGTTWRYLPKALVSSLRIFVKAEHSPSHYLIFYQDGHEYIADRKTIILRGGLL